MIRILKDMDQSVDQEQNLLQAPKKGFLTRYFDPIFRKLFNDRKLRISSEGQALPSDESMNSLDNLKLDDMVSMSESPLFRIQTVFPFVLFTDEIIIDINKISIIFREFFGSQHVHSVLIKDVSDVIVETNPFFATLKIVDVGFTEDFIVINYLRRSEGERACKIIQGLMAAHRSNIDLTKVDTDTLTGKLETIGGNGNLN